MVKDNLYEGTIVTTEDALKNAIKAGYGTIYIQGHYANKIAGKVRKYGIGNNLANIGMIIGIFFSPVFLVGITGKLLTKDLSKYRIIEVSEIKVLIKHKSIIE